ncbi:MAG: hypothetical protein WC881_04055 [Elusimicrobiota bacterium]
MTQRDVDKLFQNGALGDGGAVSVPGSFAAAGRQAAGNLPRHHSRPAAPPVPGQYPVIAPDEVPGKLRNAINAQISKYPTGRQALSEVSKPINLRFKSLGPDTYGYRDNHEIVFGTEFVGEIVAAKDPVAAGGLKDPKRLCQYLAAHPGMIPELAAKLDDIYVHEVTHAAQSEHRRHTTSGWWKSVTIDSYGKYPVEQEWDAFRAQFQYVIEKAKTEPGCLNIPVGGGALMFKFVNFGIYLEDIKGARSSIAKQYEDKGECGRLAKMSSWGSERSYYDQRLAQEERQWPRRSYEGLLLMARARASGERPLPQMALRHFQLAYERAGKYGFLAESRGELSEVFRSLVQCFGVQSAKVKPGQMAWRIPDSDIALIQRIGSDLRVPIPGNVLNAAVSKSRSG